MLRPGASAVSPPPRYVLPVIHHNNLANGRSLETNFYLRLS